MSADEEIPIHTWSCGDCLWEWSFAGPPPDGSECDNCGGYLVENEP